MKNDWNTRTGARVRTRLSVNPKKKMKVLFIISFFNIFFLDSLISQRDWEKWGKTEISYQLPNSFQNRDYSFESDNPGKFIVKSLANTYWFFISDVDGNNCPFKPSCSSFFIQSVEETNLMQAALMFFDRFTRDMNIFKKGHYPLTSDSYFYDPPTLYSLVNPIEFIPPSEIIGPAKIAGQ
jgi:putative component of membrane protein insertase Oxa1/YidC/SpoIIIJ protein YidD